VQKLDPEKLLEQAEASGSVYKIKSGWAKFFYFAAFLMFIFVVTIPVSIWFIIVGRRARVAITDEGFAVAWFFKKAYAWEDIESFESQRLSMSAGGQGGLVGALAVAAASEVIAKKSKGLNGPLMFRLKGKKQPLALQGHAIENSVAMAQEMERHTGLVILQSEDGKIP
jgi:hypothetical protein